MEISQLNNQSTKLLNNSHIMFTEIQCKKLLNDVCATLSLGHLVILETYKELELHDIENNRDRILFLNRKVRAAINSDKYILMQVSTLCAPLDCFESADCGNS